MAKQSVSFTMLVPPERIWTALTDFNVWDRYLGVPEPKNKGWGDRMKLLGPAGQGARLEMLLGEEPVQEWVIEEWTPPTRLRLASAVWHGSPRLAMESKLDVRISKVSDVENKVEIDLETAFSHPVMSLFLAIIPLKGDLRACLSKMERNLIELASGGQ